MPVYYDIELASARQEAVMARINSIMSMLLDGNDSQNRHTASAADIMLDENFNQLGKCRNLLVQEAETYYDSINSHPIRDSTVRLTNELNEISSRYLDHMTRTFSQEVAPTQESCTLILTMTPMANLAACQHLHSEMMLLEPGEVARQAYRDALKETACYIPSIGVIRRKTRKLFRTDHHRRLQKQAVQALDEIERLAGVSLPDNERY